MPVSKIFLYSFTFFALSTSFYAEAVPTPTIDKISIYKTIVDKSTKEANKLANAERTETGHVEVKSAEEGKRETSATAPPRIGNFALPGSQQPSLLYAFGGNIVDQGEVLVYLVGNELIGRHKVQCIIDPSVVVGINEKFSIYFNLPFAPKLVDGRHQSAGLEDSYTQLEYAFYNATTYRYEDQATLVGSLSVPTGSKKRDPPTGFGNPSFFVGSTFGRTYINYFFYTAQGATLTTSDHKTKFGDQFFYQFGMGRCLPSPEGWIYAVICELDGQYNRKNRLHGKQDSNSGGNTLFIAPSIWLSSKDLIIQAGFSFPLLQNLFGHQSSFDWGVNFSFSYSFYQPKN